MSRPVTFDLLTPTSPFARTWSMRLSIPFVFASLTNSLNPDVKPGAVGLMTGHVSLNPSEVSALIARLYGIPLFGSEFMSPARMTGPDAVVTGLCVARYPDWLARPAGWNASRLVATLRDAPFLRTKSAATHPRVLSTNGPIGARSCRRSCVAAG